MLLEISHHLCDKFTVQGARRVGATGRTGNKRLTNAPCLQKLLCDALKVLIKAWYRLTTKNRFNIKTKVVNEHPEISSKRLLHQVTNVIQFFLSRNPRYTSTVNILNTQIAKNKWRVQAVCNSILCGVKRLFQHESLERPKHMWSTPQIPRANLIGHAGNQIRGQFQAVTRCCSINNFRVEMLQHLHLLLFVFTNLS